MKTTRNEALKLEYGIPATTMLLWVLREADELAALTSEAARVAGELEAGLAGEALARMGGALGAVQDADDAVRGMLAFLDESGLREAGERMG